MCPYCSEPVTADDTQNTVGTGDGIAKIHAECIFRLIAGLAAHQLKECTCYGGEREDPPNFTKRAAALLSVETYHQLNREQPLESDQNA